MARRITLPELNPIVDIKETAGLLARQDGVDKFITYENFTIDMADTLRTVHNENWNAGQLDGTDISIDSPLEGEVAVYRDASTGFVNEHLKVNDLDWAELGVNEFNFLRLDSNGDVISDKITVNSLISANSTSAHHFLRIDENSQNVVPVVFDPDEFTINAQYIEGQSLSDLDGRFLNASANFSDVPDKAQARNSIDVYSTSESDTAYARRTANLSDLNNKTIAFDNIKQKATTSYVGAVELSTSVETRDGLREDLATTPKGIKDNYYNKTESDNSYLKVNQNLNDLDNKTLARSNLSVFSQLESDHRYLRAGLNLSDLTSKGIGRSNLEVYSIEEVDTLLSGVNSVPFGAIMVFPVATVPDGWLKCNGASISKSSYSNLYDVIGGTYGETSDTFKLPDLRGEFVRGWDDGRGVDAGRAIGSFQADENKSHSHGGSTGGAGGHSHTYSYTNIRTVSKSDSHRSHSQPVGYSHSTRNTSSVSNHTHSLSISASGGNESRPRNVAMVYCIKY